MEVVDVRTRRWLMTSLVVIALIVPVIRDEDSFPLSTQPMYATARDRTEAVVSAIGVSATGEARRLSLGAIAATDDPLVAESLLERSIRNATTGELCRDIADRVGGDEDFAGVELIEILTESVDLVAFVADDAPATSRTVHDRCPVVRP